MNADAAEPGPQLPAESWSREKILLLMLLAFAAHLGFIFLFGAKKNPAPRVARNIPEFHLATGAGELARLADPTLFAVPHTEDFPAGIFPEAADVITAPEFRRTEPPQFLADDGKSLGAAFGAFMRTNRIETAPVNFKPEPQFTPPVINLEPTLPQNSPWSLAGGLAGRRVLNELSAPALAANDVLEPSRVQLFVSPDGDVLSIVLLKSSGLDAADQSALKLAQTLRFAPANAAAFGEIIFNWRTVPVAAP